jgi:Putative Actinobacterial Holin-X, holin superfamily III
MVHPIFSVLVTKPELVMEHVAGYASLMRDEASSVGKEVAKRAIAWGVTLFALLVFLILAGVAAMLAAVQDQFHWAFLLVPAVALAIAVVGFSVARKPLPEKAFGELKAQLDADAQALRAIGARS